MYLKIKGLVLRVTVYNDTDALLTLLTHSHGKITVKARGLRRKNSPLAAPCQLLAYAEFTLFHHKEMYTINEAHSISLFLPLRKDIVKLSLASYFGQVAELLCQEDMPNPELLSLVLNCLYALTELPLDERLVKSVFELRSACLSGYAPDLSGCAVCGREEGNRLDLSEGHLICASCYGSGGNSIRMPITPGALDAMRYICFCEKQKLFSFQINADSLANLSQVTEYYLLTQLERGFSTLDYYKSLLI